MDSSSKYWQICRLSLASNKGYEFREVTAAKEFYRGSQMQSSSSMDERLLSLFKADSALAGLCLRCYVSYPILKACQRLSALFSSNYNFSYQDLLPFVLNDDGQNRVILGKDNKTQLIEDSDGNERASQYRLFTVEILASYKSDDSSMSLKNWAFLQTKQNSELKQFLAEFGFQHLSNWAMLNRVGVRQLSQLAPDDRHLIEVFHGVYRRDRQRATSRGKCPVPNSQQLREMQELLRDRHCIFTSNAEILAALNRVAQLLRQYDIWSSRESLEVYQPDSGDYITRRDLPVDESNDAIASEEAELLDFIRDSLQQALENAIAQASNIRIAKLTKSKKYRPYADKFLTGLKLYYAEEMSLKEITPLLGLGNWDRARRVLNPGEFLSSVRTQTILQTWLNERIPERKIARHHEGQTHHLQIGDFTLTAIAVEHLWDETVRIFQHQLAYPTHFYGVVEVVEEEEEIIFRGLMRRDRLDDYLAEYEQPGNGVYSLPLSLFDPEPNHLITYCQHLSPEAIPLPAIAVESEPEPAIGITPTKLTRWLQDSVISGWKTLENLLDPRFNVAFNTRSIDREYVRGKLIDVGLEMKHITMTLLIAVKEEDEKLKTKVQLYPSSTQQYLPASVQLSLLSRTGKTLQSIQARERDNLIQLKPFKGKSGTRFSLEVALDDARIVEEFEL